jgi:hypothetical protein
VLQRKLDAVAVEQTGEGAAPLVRSDQAIGPEMSYGLGSAAVSTRGKARMVQWPTEGGKRLGPEQPILGSLDRLAVDPLNKGPVLRSKIGRFQQDEA